MSASVPPNGPSRPAPPELRKEALRRIKKRRDFASHLFVFVVVNGGFWAVWALTGGSDPWPAWITGIWGIGIVLNAWEVYGRRPITEAEIRHEVDRLRPQH